MSYDDYLFGFSLSLSDDDDDDDDELQPATAVLHSLSKKRGGEQEQSQGSISTHQAP